MSITPVPAIAREQLKNIKTNGSMHPLEAINLDAVDVEPIDWLWEPFIAKRKLTAMTGEEGIGKSWITCSLAAIVSRGWKFPNTSTDTPPGRVLFLASEDGLGDTLKPRLNSVHADQTRIFGVAQHFSFDDVGILRFRNLVSQIMPALIIIDPFFSYLSAGLNINLATEIRPVTAKLAHIAEDYNCAFLLVRHVGKAKGMGDARAAGLGSIDFRAVCRSELLVGRDPDNAREGAIVQIKNNLAEFGRSIGYRIDDGELRFKDTSLTAERILSAAKTEDDRAETGEAAAFLMNALAGGECEAFGIKKQATQLGISDKMLRGARVKLGVEVFKRGNVFGKNQRWYWRLGGAEMPGVEIDF